MTFNLKYFILFLAFINSCLIIGQNNFILKNDASEKIDFELISNLIIIPLEVNDVTLNFILDTGVGKTIIFNLAESDSLDFGNTEIHYIHGLGSEGQLRTIKSGNNRIKIGDAVSFKNDLYVVSDDSVSFSSRLGIVVHGIIGYDLFKHFIVEINYSSKYIRLHKPDVFEPKRSKKWKKIPLNIYREKPYVTAEVEINGGYKYVNLLVDSGSSDALWLFEDLEKNLKPIKNMSFSDYLGRGLSGSIYGERSKAKGLKISNFNFKNVNVAFPDSVSVNQNKVFKERDGSIGGNLLKRFNLFIDYNNSLLFIKKSRFYKEKFTYNNSGIVLEHNGDLILKEKIFTPSFNIINSNVKNLSSSVSHSSTTNYDVITVKPAFKIVEIRKSSNAYLSGLRIEDILISINGKPAYNYSLLDINSIFKNKTGKNIWVEIKRRGEIFSYKFKLDNAFK
jgi:hypothetical protein